MTISATHTYYAKRKREYGHPAQVQGWPSFRSSCTTTAVSNSVTDAQISSTRLASRCSRNAPTTGVYVPQRIVPTLTKMRSASVVVNCLSYSPQSLHSFAKRALSISSFPSLLDFCTAIGTATVLHWKAHTRGTSREARPRGRKRRPWLSFTNKDNG